MRDSWLDRSAVGLSGLCVVHCLAGSLLLAAASSLGGLLSHEVHAIGLAIALPLAVVALWRGVQRHGCRSVAALGGAGLGLMGLALLQAHGQPAEIVLTLAGVTLLAGAHLLNIRRMA